MTQGNRSMPSGLMSTSGFRPTYTTAVGLNDSSQKIISNLTRAKATHHPTFQICFFLIPGVRWWPPNAPEACRDLGLALIFCLPLCPKTYLDDFTSQIFIELVLAPSPLTSAIPRAAYLESPLCSDFPFNLPSP